MLCLLSTSKTVAAGGTGDPWDAGPLADGEAGALRRELVRVAREVAAAGGDAARRLFDADGATLDRACEAAAALDDAPTMPAVERYTGQQWSTRRSAGERLDGAGRTGLDGAGGAVVAVSGLWGPILETAAVPAYRLPPGGRLPDGRTAAQRWRDLATATVVDLADRHGGRVLDLLPAESRAALDLDALKAAGLEVLPVDLVRADGGRVGSVRAKQARGGLAAHVVSGAPLEAFTTSPGMRWEVTVADGAVTATAVPADG